MALENKQNQDSLNSVYRDRPLSPHLTIYRWQLTMFMSILHRATGVFLVAGAVLLVWILITAGLDRDLYLSTHDLLNNWFGCLLILGWSFALYYHLFNGLRHLVWDIGYGFLPKNAFFSGVVVMIISLIATALTWMAAS